MAVDAEALQSSTVTIVVQVNGKLRGHISVAADADEDAVRAAALADANVQEIHWHGGDTQSDHRAGQARQRRGVRTCLP